MLKSYELTYLISPDLAEEKLKKLSQEIKDFITQENGTLGRGTDPIKSNLGYPIKKKTEAFLASLNFSFNPGNLEKLEQKLKDKDEIIRYVIVSKRPVRKRPKKIPEKVPLAEKRQRKFEPIKKPLEPQKFELKEIDKKIEEILNE